MNKDWRTGIVVELIDDKTFVIECSCWLCYEYGTIHCALPHGLDLSLGDWVMVDGDRGNYNFQPLYGLGNYAYTWDMDTSHIELTSQIAEIERLEKYNQTDCGWYDTLLDQEYPEFSDNYEGTDFAKAIKAFRQKVLKTITKQAFAENQLVFAFAPEAVK